LISANTTFAPSLTYLRAISAPKPLAAPVDDRNLVAEPSPFVDLLRCEPTVHMRVRAGSEHVMFAILQDKPACISDDRGYKLPGLNNGNRSATRCRVIARPRDAGYRTRRYRNAQKAREELQQVAGPARAGEFLAPPSR